MWEAHVKANWIQFFIVYYDYDMEEENKKPCVGNNWTLHLILWSNEFVRVFGVQNNVEMIVN